MKTANRLLYLDWMRGLAAVIMLQGHVFHSFLRNDLRTGGFYVFSQFVGGMPPAIFLFLTGITLAFLMDSQERKGFPVAARWTGALRRAGYLLAVAFAFRIQLWLFTRLFSPATDSPWTEMLKVDILNCMGVGIGFFAILAMLSTRNRIKVGAILGVTIALLAPLVTQFGGSIQPQFLRDYLVPSYNYFSFFPWAAYIAFGISFGSVLRLAKGERLTWMMQRFALGGALLALGVSFYSSYGPSVYHKSEFWLDGPGLVFIKLGVLLLMISFAYGWMHKPGAEKWSWVRQLGMTSLLVYWVHIELVYGHWLGALKMNLDVGQTIVAAAVIVSLMVGLSYTRTSWPQLREGLLALFAPPAPQRVSGD
jgi:uncharacterized membrane protein